MFIAASTIYSVCFIRPISSLTLLLSFYSLKLLIEPTISEIYELYIFLINRRKSIGICRANSHALQVYKTVFNSANCYLLELKRVQI